MRVSIIDTSILVNILDIPSMNQDREIVLSEFRQLLDDESHILILPLATIIETGNHIAHIVDGNIRREKAKLMSDYLKKTANNDAPWQFYGKELSKEDLIKLAEEFTDSATRRTGLGDLSIIRAYYKYKETVPAIGTIRIWSLDAHLANFTDEMSIPPRRKNR